MSKLEYVVTRVGEHEEQVRTHVTVTNALDIDLTTDGDSMSVYRRSWSGNHYALIFGEVTVSVTEACAKQLIKKLDAEIMDAERADDAA